MTEEEIRIYEEIREIKSILMQQAESIRCVEREIATLKNAILGINGNDGVLEMMRRHDLRLDMIEHRWTRIAGIWAALSAIGAAVGVKILSNLNIF